MPNAYPPVWTLRAAGGRVYGTCKYVQQGVLMFLVCSMFLDTEEQLRGLWQSGCGYVHLVC